MLPLFGGVIEGHYLEDLKRRYSANAAGRPDVEPILTYSSVGFATSGGEFLVVETASGDTRFQLNTGGFDAIAGYSPPYLYLGSTDGFLYAVHEAKGDRPWEFSAGSAIRHPAIALKDVVYVFPEDGGVFSVASETGEEHWFAPRPRSFMAASPTRVYTRDDRGSMIVLDAKTGATVDSLPLDPRFLTYHNVHNDRIYLFTPSGLIQCLHERALPEPIVYLPPKPKPAETQPTKPAAPATTPAAMPETAEPAEEAAPAEEAVPAEGEAAEPAAEMPAEEPAAEEDAFAE